MKPLVFRLSNKFKGAVRGVDDAVGKPFALAGGAVVVLVGPVLGDGGEGCEGEGDDG